MTAREDSWLSLLPADLVADVEAQVTEGQKQGETREQLVKRITAYLVERNRRRNADPCPKGGDHAWEPIIIFGRADPDSMVCVKCGTEREPNALDRDSARRRFEHIEATCAAPGYIPGTSYFQ